MGKFALPPGLPRETRNCLEQVFSEYQYGAPYRTRELLDIAQLYSELAGHRHEMFFPAIRAEYRKCVELVLRLSRERELLEAQRTLRRAIRLRNPYVDPMSFLQVDLLERWRRGGRRDDAVFQALMASVNGIAHGMQTIG